MRIIVKIGTNTITANTRHLNRPRMIELVRQMALLHGEGHEMLLVSSGAIGAGREMLGDENQTRDITSKQVLASVGQVHLIWLYAQLFSLYDIPVAQALLTREDLAHRTRYLNARNALTRLLERRVVPVINENDVVAIDEIKIGDNDNLSALLANLVDADLLIILTDQAGLFTSDPRADPDARLIKQVDAIDEHVHHLAGGAGTSLGTGGMVTKIEAAELAIRSGCEVVIAPGYEPDVLLRMVRDGEAIGTRFATHVTHIESRKRWILAEEARGEIDVDEGAARAIVRQNKSLLAAGVVDARGDFERGQIVRVLDGGGEIARGIANYCTEELNVIRGRHSDSFFELLGHHYGPTVIHRNDMVVM